MCKYCADVMGKIDWNNEQMIKVTKNKFNDLREEILKIRSSSSKNVISSQRSTQLHSFSNVEKKSFVKRITDPGSSKR